MLACNCVDALHCRHDTAALAMAAHLGVLLLHIARLWFQHKTANLEIRESCNLCFLEQSVGQFFESVIFLQLMLEVNDMLQALQEPYVNLCQFLDALHGISLFESLCNSEDTQVGGVLQFVVEIVETGVVVTHKSVHSLTNHAQSLLYHLLKRATYCHNLANRLHRRTDKTAHSGKLGQVPTGNLAYHIVELRSHVCRVGGSHLTNLVEGITKGNLCSNKSERITCCLGSKGGRTRQTGVYLDDTIVISNCIEGKLDIALTHYLKVAHATD